MFYFIKLSVARQRRVGLWPKLQGRKIVPHGTIQERKTKNFNIFL
jgi:hypothetical protein